MKTRSRTEIISLILLRALEEESLTHSKVMYQAMLNFTQVTDYTSFPLQQELLNYSRLDRKYSITDKGRQFLTLFMETSKLLTATTTPENDGNLAGDNNLHQAQKQQLPPPQQQEVTVHK